MKCPLSFLFEATFSLRHSRLKPHTCPVGRSVQLTVFFTVFKISVQPNAAFLLHFHFPKTAGAVGVCLPLNDSEWLKMKGFATKRRQTDALQW